MFKIKMGEKAKDNVTGFNGIVTARSEYLTGCRQYLVQPKMNKGETKYPEPQWFDEDRLHNGEPANYGGPQVYSAPIK